MRFLSAFVALLAALIIVVPQTAMAQEQKQPTAVGSGGAAASVDMDGTRAAIQALRDGGNAVDAAVAAASVLGVTEPYSCGIGGGGFMVIRTARGKVTTIDGREESPATMKPDSFWENGEPLAIRRRPLQRHLRRHPRHAGHLGAGAAALRHLVARPGAPARHPRGQRRLQGRPDIRGPDDARTSTGSTTSPRPPRSTWTRTARRATRARPSETRTSRARTGAWRAGASTGSTTAR